MFLDIRKRILLIIFLTILFLVLIYFLLLRKSAPAPAPVVTSTTEESLPVENIVPVPSDVIIRTPPPPPPANPEEREKMFMVQLSKIFVERYLSHSNQNKNTHITDVKNLVTAKMYSYLETQKTPFDDNYKGVSTKVISSSLLNFDGAQAEVQIGIQQYVEEKDKNPVTQYKTGKVTLVQEEKDWRVSGLYLDPQ